MAVLGDFTAEEGQEDVLDLLRVPAGATTLADLAPPTPPWRPPYAFRGAPDGQDEEAEPAQQPVRRTVVAEAILEAAVYKTDDQPRWPAGTPGGKGGQWIETGQTFTAGGKTWQVAHIVKGTVYAHEASAKYGHVETRAFNVVKGRDGKTTFSAGTYVPPTKVPVGGKDTSAAELVIVDPYVDASTHDASMPIPAGSSLSAEQWQRFGKVDQDHYTELMERFGKHKPGAAKTHVDASYNAYQSKVQQMVKQGYSSQYGSSSGFSLSLAAQGKSADSPEKAKLREEALALQAEHKAAVQWDLYNRTLSPDVTVAHRSSQGVAYWQKNHIDGNQPVFSGLSQSWSFDITQFGSSGILTPLAIRHVLLSSHSAQPVPGSSSFPGELEVAVAEQLKLDHRTLAFTEGTGPGALSAVEKKWLHGTMQQPQGGELLETLLESRKNGDTLPIPPAKPNITMDNSLGKTWADPPQAATTALDPAKLPQVSGSNLSPATLDKSLPWQHKDDDGNPKAVTGEDAGAYAGQYFMGLKGTLYWIGPDPAVGGGYPFRIHKIENGQFNGENFPYKPELPGYYLDAHFVVPKEEDTGDVTFDPSQWGNGTEQAFLEKFEPGDKFKLNGAVYEVTGPMVSTGMPVKDLESGLTGKINGDYKTVKLVASDGSQPVPGEDAPPAPQVGMTFPYNVGPGEFKKATITVIKGDGSVQVNLSPGKVVIPDDEWAAYADKTFDPSAWNIAAEPVKLRDMQPGDKFQGGAGNQTLRPYEVVEVPSAGKVTVRNMDTGKVSQMGRNVSYRQLEAKPAPGSAAEGEQDTPDSPAAAPSAPVSTDLAENINPRNLSKSAHPVNPGDWVLGTVIGKDKPSAVIVGHEVDENGKTTKLTLASITHPGSDVEFEGEAELGILVAKHVWTPKGEKPAGDLTDGPPPEAAQTHNYVDVNGSKYTVSEGYTKTGQLKPGTVYQTGGKNGKPTKYYKISDDGESAVSMTSGKSWPLKKSWGVKTLEPVQQHPPDSVDGFDLEEWTPEPDTSALAGLPVGTVYQHDNGSVFKKTADGQGEAIYTPDSASMQGVEWPQSGEAIVTPLVRKASTPGTIDPATFDPDGWENEAESGYFEDLAVGKVFATKSGSIFQKVDGEQAMALDASGYDKGATLTWGGATTWPMKQTTPGAGNAKDQVFSGGWPLSLESGEPIIKGQTYYVSGEPVTAMGSGNVVGTVLVKNADGSTTTASVPELTIGLGNGWVQAADLKDKAGAKFQWGGVTMSVAKDQAGADSNELFAIAPDGKGWLVKNLVELESGIGATSTWNEGDLAVGPGGHKVEVVGYTPGNGDYPGGSVTVKQLDGGKVVSYNGANLKELPTTTELPKGTLVHAVRPLDPMNPSLGSSSVVGHVEQVLPNGYVMVTGSNLTYKPENVTSLASYPFKPGDDVQHDDGAVGDFGYWEVNGSGEPVMAVFIDGDMELWNPDMAALASKPVPDMPFQELTPKAGQTLTHAQLAPGDATTLKTLQKGDHYLPVGPAGNTGATPWVVVEPPASPQDNGKIQKLGADGQPTGIVYDLYPDAPVQLQAKAADAAAAPKPVEHAVDLDSLPDASDHGFVGYKSHKGSGGKWSHHMVKTMPEGTTFADLNGKQWKVKQAGAQPVITDGESLFKVSGQLRGKDLNQPAVKQNANLVDNSPPVGWHTPGPLMVPSDKVPFAELGLTPGDTFKISSNGGAVWTVKATDADGYVVAQTADGAISNTFGPYNAPSHVNAAAMIKTATVVAPDAEPDAGASPTLYTAPSTAAGLQLGEKFTLAPGSSQVYTVWGKSAGNTVQYELPDGSSATLASFDPVYVEPGAPATPLTAPATVAQLGVGDKFALAPGGEQYTVTFKNDAGIAYEGGDLGAGFDASASPDAQVYVEDDFLPVEPATQPVDPATVTTINDVDEFVEVPPVDPSAAPTVPSGSKWTAPVLKQMAQDDPEATYTITGPDGKTHEGVKLAFSIAQGSGGGGWGAFGAFSGVKTTAPQGKVWMNQQGKGWKLQPASLVKNVQVEPKDAPDVTPADSPVELSAAVAEPAPLQAFGSRLGPGGIYKHDKLSELQVGQLFTDKSGKDYQLVSHGEGSAYYQNMATGAVMEAKNDLRVKRTALPPEPAPLVKTTLAAVQAKYGGLDNVPPTTVTGYTTATGEGGTVKYPRLGHLKAGEQIKAADGTTGTHIASWLDKSLVYMGDGEWRIIPAATRVKRIA